MIGDLVRKAAGTPAEEWNRRVPNVPQLQLDMNWPSVGVLDQISFFLRGNEQLTPEERTLVRRTSAYIAMLVHDTWTAFGATVEVNEGDEGVFVRAIEGPLLPPGREAKLLIEQHLRRLLKEVPNPLPVAGSFERQLGTDHNLLSLFAVGAVTGLSPYVEGPWSTTEPKVFAEYLDKAVKHVARTAADWYARVYPDEQIGQVGELYLNELIYPPTLMSELLPGTNGVIGALNFFKEYGLSQKAMLRVAQNLSMSPDERLSQVGLALTIALAPDVPSPEVLAVAESKGSYVGLLRAAVVTARGQLGKRSEWIEEGEFTEEDSKLFDTEMQVNLIPWLKMPKAFMRRKKKEPRLVPFLQALAFFNFKESVKLLDEILAEAPGELELRIQRIYLDLIDGQMDKSSREFRLLLSEPGAEDLSMLYNLWGLCELARGDTEAAKKQLQMAVRTIRSSNPLEEYQVHNNLAWALIVRGELPQALEVLESSLRKYPAPVTALLNKAYVLRNLGRHDEAKPIQQRLLKLSPLDRRVFANI